jgi:hypothetical protein
VVVQLGRSEPIFWATLFTRVVMCDDAKMAASSRE